MSSAPQHEITSTEEVDVRASALAHATRLFAARGVAGTSLQAVADAVGVSKPTLVYHFGSKDGLREAVLEALLGHWQRELPRMMAAATSGGPRLDNLLHALFAFFLDDRSRAVLLMREALDQPEHFRELLHQHLQPWTRMLSEAVRSGQASGAIRPEVDPEAYVQLVITSGLGALALGDRVNALLAPEPSLDAQLAELVRIARTSLLVPPFPPAPEEA